MENTTFADRLGRVVKDFCERERISFRHFALHHLGMGNEQTLASAIQRKTTRPRHELVTKVVAVTGCRVEWLTSGTGEMYPVRSAAGLRVAEELAQHGAAAPAGVIVFHVTDEAMAQGDYRPRAVLAVPKGTAESGQLALVEMGDGQRRFRKVFYDDATVTLVAAAGSVAPEVLPRARVKRMMRVWAVVLLDERA
jgi:hypothetical protein